MSEKPFTNADYLRVMARLSRKLASATADLAGGAWNPDFCSTDASVAACRMCDDLAEEIDHLRSLALSEQPSQAPATNVIG